MDGSSSFDRRRFLKIAGFVGILGGASEVGAAAPSGGNRNELLVGVSPSANARRVAKRALPPEARIVSENETLGYVRVELPEQAATTVTAQTADRVASRSGVEYAEPNASYEALVVPNDPRFDDQYAPEAVNAPGAWNSTLGTADVTIAVVDEGIKYDHPDLKENVASDPGRDFVDSDDDPYPDVLVDEHHGTHVAGIAAAGTDNDTGIAGISNATLLSVRALDETGVGSTADIADGIQWATDNGADIINLSLGGGYTKTLQKAVTYANENGVLLVAAAGNDYGGPVSYPAAYDECIAVSALDPDGSLAPYSNTGSEIELCAPGTNLLSTWTDDGYDSLSGTSMAAPIVSGVAGLVLSVQDLSNTEVRAKLKNTAADIGLSGEEQGAGRIDAATAVGALGSTLTIEGAGGWTNYSFTVDGSVDPIQVNGHDSIRNNGADGYVGDGVDRYAFSGELAALDVNGQATVRLDGDRIDPASYSENVLTIEGSGGWTNYDFTVTGSVDPIVVNGHDSVRPNGSEGFVGSGYDRYAFSGELAALDVNGDATVRLNGDQIDPAAYSRNVLTIEGAGGWTDYSFTVSGSVDPIQVNGHDAVRERGADGHVGRGIDRYAFSGTLAALDVDGDATVRLDGDRIDQSIYPENVLRIAGAGGWTDYSFTVTDSVDPIQVNGHDSTRPDGATGHVGGGVDRYAFSGELLAFDLDGEANVTVNGEPAHVGQRPDHALTIEGTGGWTDYSFTVDGEVDPIQVNGHESVRNNGAEGHVGGGTDRYTFSGELLAFDLDGEAVITLDGEPAHVGQRPDHVLTIEGSGGWTKYSVTASGSVDPIQVNGHDSVRNDGAEGFVGGGTDRYAFSGTITRLVLNERARITLDRSDRTVTIKGNGKEATYSFSVGGNVEAVQGTDGDTVHQHGVTGFVNRWNDRYRYTGDFHSVSIGDVSVTVDGKSTQYTESPSIGVYSGLSDADFNTVGRMESWQNTDYDVQNLFVPWNADSGHMNWLFDRILPKIWNAGRTPLITWEPYTPGARAASVDTQSLVEQNEYDAYLEGLADTTPNDIEVRIGNGDYDRYIDGWAGRLRNALSKSGDRRAYLRLAHEMNGDWYPWSPTVGNSNPRSYVRMWRHVHNRFDRQGIDDDLQWMWCVNAEDVGSYRAERLFPGDRYVDWLGLDGYNWGRSKSWSSWDSPDSIYGGMLDRLSGLSNKPICVAEFASSSKVGVGHDPRRKDEWIHNAISYFENRGVDLWCWFNENKETDWKVFDSMRGTERVRYNGGRVNAYEAYRTTIGTTAAAANETTASSLTTERIDGD